MLAGTTRGVITNFMENSMFNLDQAVRDAQANVNMLISVRTMEVKLDIHREFNELRERSEELWAKLFADLCPNTEQS